MKIREATAALRAAVGRLVGWHDQARTRRQLEPCACQECPICQGRRLAARGAQERLVRTARELVERHGRTACGTGESASCGTCLVCELAQLLYVWWRVRHHRTELRPQRQKIRVKGGLCVRGHLLDEENAHTLPSGLIVCRACGRELAAARRASLPNPKRRKPGFCAAGLHERTPENLYHRKGGDICKPCTQQYQRIYKAVRRRRAAAAARSAAA